MSLADRLAAPPNRRINTVEAFLTQLGDGAAPGFGVDSEPDPEASVAAVRGLLEDLTLTPYQVENRLQKAGIKGVGSRGIKAWREDNNL